MGVFQNTTNTTFSYNIYENAVENIIDRPHNCCDLVLTYSSIFAQIVIGWYYTSSYVTPANMTILFELEPIEDY
jgi:hypothetical protein